MTATLQRTQRRQFPVHSKPDATIYLAMHECADGYGVLISPSKLGKTKLGAYWKVWVRDWIMKLDAKYVGKIRFSSQGVWFVSDYPVDTWVWPLQAMLANVTPLAKLPMKQRQGGGDCVWKVDRKVDLTSIIDAIKLPHTVWRHYSLHGGNLYVFLRRRGRNGDECPIPMREVRHMVELQVALACTQNGAPPNEDWLQRQAMRSRMGNLAPRPRPIRRKVTTVELPPLKRQRRRTIRGVPVERGAT